MAAPKADPTMPVNQPAQGIPQAVHHFVHIVPAALTQAGLGSLMPGSGNNTGPGAMPGGPRESRPAVARAVKPTNPKPPTGRLTPVRHGGMVDLPSPYNGRSQAKSPRPRPPVVGKPVEKNVPKPNTRKPGLGPRNMINKTPYMSGDVPGNGSNGY